MKGLVTALSLMVLVVTLGAALSATAGQPDGPTDVLEATPPAEVPTNSARTEAESANDGDLTPPAEIDREAAAGPLLEDGDFVESAAVPPPVPSPQVRRVGIQAGHWNSGDLPAELSRLRTSTGTSGGGVAEWELNLDIARRVASKLGPEGLEVDLLPATIPPGYRADAFVALHADGDISGQFSGFKLATPRVSTIAEADEALMAAITREYQAATRLPLDHRISRNMTGYYAFTFRRFQHAIAPTTPAVIVEMGFLTNASDRLTLLGKPDAVAEGIAQGILRFLREE